MSTKKLLTRLMATVLVLASLLTCVSGVAFAAPAKYAVTIAPETLEVSEATEASPETKATGSTARASAASEPYSVADDGDYAGAAAAATTHSMPEVNLPTEYEAMPDTTVGTLLQFTDGSAECGYTWVHNPTTTTPTVGGGLLKGTLGASDPQVKTTSQSLNYTIAATDIVELRVKLTDCDSTGTKLGSVFYWSPTTNLTSFGTGGNASTTIDGSSREYQVLTYDIGSKSAGGVIGGIRFDIINSDVGMSYEIDYIYIGPAESAPSAYADYLFFDFEGNADDLARYKSSIYGGLDFDAANASTGIATNWNNGGNVSSLKISDGALNVTGIPSKTGLFTVYSGPNSNNRQPLQYSPADDDYCQVRFKISNAAMHSGTTAEFRLYYYCDEATGTNYNYDEVSFNLSEVLDKGYYVLSFPLDEANYLAANQITGIMPAINSIRSADGTNGIEYSIDWLYVGPAEKQPVHDHLFFDFTNTAEDQARYSSKTYGEQNFDQRSNWKHRTYTMNTAAISTSAPGALSSTLLASPTRTDGSNYFETSKLLGYDPTAGDYLQMRLKIAGAALSGTYTNLKIGAIFSYNGGTNWSDFQYETVDASVIDKDYFTVTIPLSSTVTNYNTIDKIRLRFDNFTNASGSTATITVDWVYIGQKETLPVQDFLYFDFENNPDDQVRYSSKTYGGMNYDLTENWSISTNASHSVTAVESDNTLGVLDCTIPNSTLTQGVVHTGTAYNSYKLQYAPKSGDYLEMRVKVDGGTASSSNGKIRIGLYYVYYDKTKGYHTVGQQYSDVVFDGYANDGYIVVSFPMANDSVYTGANEIRALRPYVNYLTGDATFSIDYIYIGPEEYRPSTDGDALFIDFTGDEAAVERYTGSGSEVYGGVNFDQAENYNLSSTCTSSVSTDGIGSMTLTSVSGRTSFYAQTAEANGTSFPLHFRPEVNDVVQMRFKISGAANPTAALYFRYDDNSVAMGNTTRAVDSVNSNVINTGDYYIMNIEMPDTFTDATRVNVIRPQFSFSETSGVVVEIDYIYIGPQESAPYSYQASRSLASVDTTGMNYRITYNIDFFKPEASGQIRLKELLQQEFELYDSSDKTTGVSAIKLSTVPYVSQGNYSSTKTKVTSPVPTVATENSATVIRLTLDNGDTAYRRDNAGDTVAGVRYILEINFRVNHNATLGGNDVLVNKLKNSWTTFQPRNSSGDLMSDDYLREYVQYSEENLNIPFAAPVAHDFFMELYGADSAASDYTTALTAVGNSFGDEKSLSVESYSTYNSSMLSAGQKLDLLEYLNYVGEDGAYSRVYGTIFANMMTNRANGTSNKYTSVVYWVSTNDGDDTVDAYDDLNRTSRRYYRESVRIGESTPNTIDVNDPAANSSAPILDPTKDQLITIRAFYIPTEDGTPDTLGRSDYGKYTVDIDSNKESYAYYYAPKFAVIDSGSRTVSVDMELEGQQIGTWEDPTNHDKGVKKSSGFHILSTNGQLDEGLSNIKYNVRQSFMNNSDRTILSEPTYVYYLTRSEHGEKGATKRTIASFETEISELLEGTGIAYDMDLDQYYSESANSQTYTFGDATLSPAALEGEYYTTMRKLTIIPANNVYYDLDKTRGDGLSDQTKWIVAGAEDYDNQTHDNTSVHGYDANWYARAEEGEESGLSYGRAYKVTVSSSVNNIGRMFTFNGTGFEIISSTTPDTGVLVAEVYTGSAISGTPVRRYLVDTYLKDNSLTQIPVVVCNDLAYGTYTVRVRGYYHNIFDHNYTITPTAESASATAATKGAATTLNEAMIRQALGLSDDEPLTFIPSASGYEPAKRGTTVTYRGYYDVYLDGFRIYNPIDDVITEAEHPMVYYAYRLAGEVNTSATETATEFYNIKNDLLLDRTTWTGNTTNGVLYLGDGTTNVEQADEVSGVRLGMNGTLETVTEGGTTYLVDSDKVKLTSTCHNAYISYSAGTNLDGETAYHYYCECGTKRHEMNNGSLRESGVTFYHAKYEMDGPENELYLKAGSGIAFEVGTSGQVQISLKSVNSKEVQLYAYDGTEMVPVELGVNEKGETIYLTTSINVEMYYRLDSKYIHGGSVYLMCKTADGNTDAIMSICSIKVYDGNKPTIKAALAFKAMQIFEGAREAENTEPEYVLDENLTFSTSISVGADMQVAYTVLSSKVSDYENFYLEVSKNVAGSAPITVVYELDSDSTALEPITNPSTGVTMGYRATYTGINAKEMGDEFTATLYAVASDGTIYCSSANTNSIQSYLMARLEDSAATAEMKTLAVDMLNYGAAAQVNFSYDTDNLVNAVLTEDQLKLGTQEIPDAENQISTSGDGVNVSASVTLESKVVLYVTCMYASAEDSDLQFVIKDAATGEVLAQKAPSMTLENACQGIYDAIGAKQMRDLITIELYDNGERVSKTLTWSIESYVAQTRDAETTSDVLRNMVNAMLIYGDSAAAYLATSGQ